MNHLRLCLLLLLLPGGLLLSCSQTSPPANPKPGQIWHDQRTDSDFCFCPPGTFLMGSDPENPDHTDDQGPLHQVTLTRGFWLGKGLVTQALWRSTMGTIPSSNEVGDGLPVETISWQDCQAFLKSLSGVFTGHHYRLPTEAEWEYACKAGTPEPTRDELALVLQGYGAGPGRTASGRIVNAWGIEEMIGRRWQWCADYRGPYPAGPVVDPVGPSTGNDRIARGYPGSQIPSHAHSFYRWYCRPDQGYYQLGLRLVLKADR